MSQQGEQAPMDLEAQTGAPPAKGGSSMMMIIIFIVLALVVAFVVMWYLGKLPASISKAIGGASTGTTSNSKIVNSKVSAGFLKYCDILFKIHGKAADPPALKKQEVDGMYIQKDEGRYIRYGKLNGKNIKMELFYEGDCWYIKDVRDVDPQKHHKVYASKKCNKSKGVPKDGWSKFHDGKRQKGEYIYVEGGYIAPRDENKFIITFNDKKANHEAIYGRTYMFDKRKHYLPVNTSGQWKPPTSEKVQLDIDSKFQTWCLAHGEGNLNYEKGKYFFRMESTHDSQRGIPINGKWERYITGKHPKVDSKSPLAGKNEITIKKIFSL